MGKYLALTMIHCLSACTDGSLAGLADQLAKKQGASASATPSASPSAVLKSLN